jgi:hypothetical protein
MKKINKPLLFYSFPFEYLLKFNYTVIYHIAECAIDLIQKSTNQQGQKSSYFFTSGLWWKHRTKRRVGGDGQIGQLRV